MYWRVPRSGPSAALRKAVLTSSRLTALRRVTVRSATLPQVDGHSEGETRQLAFQAQG